MKDIFIVLGAIWLFIVGWAFVDGHVIPFVAEWWHRLLKVYQYMSWLGIV